MTESKADTAAKPAKELLALNPKQDSEFKKKVQEAKKKKPGKVGREEAAVAYKQTCGKLYIKYYLYISHYPLKWLLNLRAPVLSVFTNMLP